jgi:hypothetical protein
MELGARRLAFARRSLRKWEIGPYYLGDIFSSNISSCMPELGTYGTFSHANIYHCFTSPLDYIRRRELPLNALLVLPSSLPLRGVYAYAWSFSPLLKM